MLLHAVGGWFLGEDVDWKQVLLASGIASLRSGIGKIPARTALMLCLPLLFLGTGCQMLQKRFSDPANVAFVAGLAQNAAKYGVMADLKAHPEHRVAFEIAAGSLDALVARGDFTASDLSAVLAGITMEDGNLEGDAGALLLGDIGTVVVLDIATMFGFDINELPALKAVAAGIGTGIRAGLASPVIIVRTRDITSPADVPRRELVPVKVRRI